VENDWEKAIAFVLKMEGGETAELDPNDPGGLTKYGISQQAYPSLDIRGLSLEDAKKIYRRDYWERCKCDDLPQALALCVFDCAVNQGPSVARRILQMSLGVTVDGIIGPKTLAAASKATKYHVKKFLAERLAAYLRLMFEKPVLKVYAVNWSYRVLSLSELVLN